jgi:hypothetical protein
MKHIKLFEDFIPLGFGVSTMSTYSLGATPNINTGYNMASVVGSVMKLSEQIIKEASVYELNDNPKHTANEYLSEAKKSIIEIIENTCEQYSITNEAADYIYNPTDHAERLKRREKQNIERFRAAQDRQDNYAISLYELKIKIDKIDLEKIKILAAINNLKKQNNKI